VYSDGAWKTMGPFVAEAHVRVDDPDEVLNGFCLRIVGRLVDLAALTDEVGKRWSDEPYTLPDLLSGKKYPTEIRWPR
jgi:hypothetical protein